jgi:hypothetical protein
MNGDLFLSLWFPLTYLLWLGKDSQSYALSICHVHSGAQSDNAIQAA